MMSRASRLQGNPDFSLIMCHNCSTTVFNAFNGVWILGMPEAPKRVYRRIPTFLRPSDYTEYQQVIFMLIGELTTTFHSMACPRHDRGVNANSTILDHGAGLSTKSRCSCAGSLLVERLGKHS